FSTGRRGHFAAPVPPVAYRTRARRAGEPTLANAFPARTIRSASMGEPAEVLAAIEASRLVPVIVIEDAGAAPRLAEALVAGGLRVAEVTFRTAGAQAALAAIAADQR